MRRVRPGWLQPAGSIRLTGDVTELREGCHQDRLGSGRDSVVEKGVVALAYICHELLPPVRSGLIAGTVDFVVAHDLPQLVRLSLQTLVEVKGAAQFRKRDNVIRS